MLEVQVPDIKAVESSLHGDLGVKMLLRPGRKEHDTPGSDWKELNSPGLSGIHWHPKSMGCIVECAQHDPPQDWLYAGTEWRNEIETREGTVFPDGSAVGVRFAGAELAVSDPIATAKLWAKGLGGVCISDTTVKLSDVCTLHFREKAHENESGLAGVFVVADSTQQHLVGKTIEVCNLAVHFVSDELSLAKSYL
jgi:hypothetical protein